jgi:hypothetical protein
LKSVHGVATYALLVFGVIHVTMAPVFFEQFSMRVMWYVAQGLMGVFVAFLNFSCRRLHWREPRIAGMTHLANLLGLVFAVLYATVDPSLPSYFGIGVFALLAGAGLSTWSGRSGGTRV